LFGETFSPAETVHFHKGDDRLLVGFDFAKTSLVLSSSGRKDAHDGVNDASSDRPYFGHV
jgi:hypothetical protein